MDKAMLIQLIGSAIAISVLVAIAAWARIARPTAPLDAAALGALLAEEFPDHHPTATWISADGAGALARDGDLALVLWRRGDGYVARDVAWSVVARARSKAGRLALRLADAAPVFAVSDDVWPPQSLVAPRPSLREELTA
ncbi:MAG: hypothetical protein PSX79_05875 [bacterium]|nr:hypothetical protein [bacterium]